MPPAIGSASRTGHAHDDQADEGSDGSGASNHSLDGHTGADYIPVRARDEPGGGRRLVELMRRGWTDGEVAKVAGENVLRVLAAAERVAAKLRASRPPAETVIDVDLKR